MKKEGKSESKHMAGMSHMMIKPAENGVIVEHHYMPKKGKSPAFMEMEDPKQFTFTTEQSPEFHAHMEEHTGMKMASEKPPEEGSNDLKEESATA